MLTVQQIRDDLGLSTDRPVLAWIRSGLLSAIDVSSNGKRPTWRIEESEYEAFKDRRRAIPVQPRPKRGRKPGRRKLKHVAFR